MYGTSTPMKKLRFVADHREALGRLKDYLISLKLRGHGNWLIGDAVDGPDGRVHMDAATFQEDPEFDVDRLRNYIPDGVSASEVPLDVLPSENITTARVAEATAAHRLTGRVLTGEDPKAVVEALVADVMAKFNPTVTAA